MFELYYDIQYTMLKHVVLKDLVTSASTGLKYVYKSSAN
jgi:hypothetical protein